MKGGQVCILEVDIQGAESLRQTKLNPYYIFVSPPSFDELRVRITKRGSETPESLAKRLQTAKRELEYFQSGAHFDYGLINDQLHVTYHTLRSKLLNFYPSLHSKYPTSIHPTSSTFITEVKTPASSSSCSSSSSSSVFTPTTSILPKEKEKTLSSSSSCSSCKDTIINMSMTRSPVVVVSA